MNQVERQRLKEIIKALQQIQQVAPSSTTYVQGRTESSIAHGLLDIIAQLKELYPDDNTETEPAV